MSVQLESHDQVAGRALGSSAVIADSYPLWLRAVESVLEGLGIATIGSASVPADGIELITELRPDILVTDIDFGGDHHEGTAFVRKALEIHPDIKVIVLTMHWDSALVAEAIAAGASAYAVKSVRPDDLAAAIRQTFEHSIFLAPVSADTVQVAAQPAGETPAALPQPKATVRRLELAEEISRPLTKRENEILQLVAEGHPNAEIARRLWVTEQTVKFHLSNIYRKLGVSNRTQASHWVHRAPTPDASVVVGE